MKTMKKTTPLTKADLIKSYHEVLFPALDHRFALRDKRLDKLENKFDRLEQKVDKGFNEVLGVTQGM